MIIVRNLRLDTERDEKKLKTKAATGLTIFFYRKVLKKMRGNNF